MVESAATTSDHVEPFNSLNQPRWQFGLRHIFGLTTIAAIAAALVAGVGAGTLMTSGGILIAWLNVCGALQGLQHGWRQAAVLWLAWGTFLVSLVLPSLMIFGPIQGYDAAWIALTGPVEQFLHGQPVPPAVIAYFAIDIANGLMLLLPLLIWRISRGRGQWLGAALCLAMVSAWMVIWKGDRMLVGYFVWSASFGLALIAIPIRIWNLAAMVAFAALLVAAGVRWG